MTVIRIVADTPTSQPKLGFERFAEAIAGAIRGGEPPQFTMGIYGGWGSGKSSLLQAIARRLSDDASVFPVLFDAWRYENDNLIVPLLHAVYEAIQERDDQLATSVGKAIVSLVRGLKMSFKIAGAGIEIDPSRMLEGDQSSSKATALDEAFSKPFHDLRQIGASLGDRRIAVLVDDLDRCRPDAIVTMLQSISVVTDVPGFIFVLALDYDVIVAAVERTYPHVSGHRFIEKIVHVPFRVPPLSMDDESFLEQLIPEWPKLRRRLPSSFIEDARFIAVTALQGNPRQVKRFINSLLLVTNVVSTTDRRSGTLLAALIGLQLGWPLEYARLATATYANDRVMPEQETAQDPTLSGYWSRFFDPLPEQGLLRRLIGLTSAVSMELTPVKPQALSYYMCPIASCQAGIKLASADEPAPTCPQHNRTMMLNRSQ